MTSYFKDGGHDVRPQLVASHVASVLRLPASPPTACNVIGWLYALQFLIHSTILLVKILLLAHSAVSLQ